MKNDRTKTIFLVVLLLFTGFSCENELDLAPPDSVSDANFWQKPNDFKQAATNYYYTLPGPAGYDQESDIQYGPGHNAVSEGVNVPPANDGFWNGRYSFLREINTMLQKAKEYPNPEEIKTSVAEGKFFRAYEYFRLVKRYGDVPYYDEPLTPTSEGLYDSRTPRAAVIANVLADLDAAIPDLPLESETTGTDQGRITQGAAQSLKAIVALFEGTWVKYHGTEGNANDLLDQAISAADAVVTSGEYELFVYDPDPTLSYKKSYSIEANDSREQVLARRYDPDVVGHDWPNAACCGGQTSGTKALADMYVLKDGLPIDKSPLFQGYVTMTSEYENRDLRMTNTLHVPGTEEISRAYTEGGPVYPILVADGGYRGNKFITYYPDAVVHGRAYEFWHVIKYSEVLLTLAEALYEKNDMISDADLDRTINLLRNRGDVAHLTNALVTANGLDMLQEIRRERSVELAWDGARLDDLKRWKMAVAKLDQPIRGVKLDNGDWAASDAYSDDVASEFPLDENGFIIVESGDIRQFSERNYLFPIPTQQIQLNPALEQNPGWQ